jgi:hypothetical protein
MNGPLDEDPDDQPTRSTNSQRNAARGGGTIYANQDGYLRVDNSVNNASNIYSTRARGWTPSGVLLLLCILFDIGYFLFGWAYWGHGHGSPSSAGALTFWIGLAVTGTAFRVWLRRGR